MMPVKTVTDTECDLITLRYDVISFKPQTLKYQQIYVILTKNMKKKNEK